MDNRKAIQKELLSQLAKGLEPQGFRRREQSFVARMPGGSHIFHVSLINHTQDFNVTADVAVRHDALQDLVHESNSLLSKKEKQQTASVGAELGNIAEGRQKRWIVAGPEDAEGVCSSILAAFTDIGVPILLRFSSLDEVLDVCARDDQEARLYEPFLYMRAMKAVGSAFLLGRRDEFQRLVEYKSVYLREQGDDFDLSYFLPFAERLATRWESSLV